MRFSELMERVRGRGVVVAELRAQSDPEILGVCEDSRKARAGDLFVARSGTKRKGTEFIDEAFARGAAAVVLQQEAGLSCGMAWARVADVNLACALLAHEVAGNPTAGMKMIGITGTKGKTTVAYLMRSVLKSAGHKVGMIGTVEIDDGKETVPAEMTTPGSVELVALFSKMKANGVTHCVMEVSSHALHQHRVAGIDFAVAIFTNLTGDHLDYHKTMEEYAAAKAMLFEGLKEGAFAVVNVDDPWAERMTRGCKARVVPYCVTSRPATGPRVIQPIELPSIPGERNHVPPGTPVMPERVPSGGFAGYIWQMSSHGMGMSVGYDYPSLGLGHTFGTPLVGKHNCYNITCVHAAAAVLGLLNGHQDIQTRASMTRVWKTATGAPGRLQRVGGDGDFAIFVDYAHTHDSLENVLNALRATMDSQLICVFGCGGDRDRTKRPKMGAIAERLADRVIVTSDNPRTENPGAIIEEICAGFSAGWQSAGKISVEPDRRAAIRAAIGMAQKGDVVLIAGKGHENYQIIGTTKHHFDDVEEAQAALLGIYRHHDVKAST